MILLDLLYAVAIVILSPWLLIMLMVRPSFRAGLFARFRPDVQAEPGRRTVWLHGSSAGEIDLLRALVTPIEALPGDLRIVISVFSISGFAVAKKAFPKHPVIYFPADFSFVVRRFLAVIDPALIVLVESELWPNFIATVHRSEVPVCVVNARMSEKSFRRHRRWPLIPQALQKLDLIAAQTEEDAGRFRELGVDPGRLSVTGNMKYDLCEAGDVDAVRKQRAQLREHYGADDEVPVLIGGSVHRGEDRALISVYKKLIERGRELRLIIVPRYPADAASVLGELENLALDGVRKTEVGGEHKPLASRQVLVVDTMGELRRFYTMSDIAFVGGSLYYRGSNKGGHNLMEPAVLGVAVLFGPYNYSFRETVSRLQKAGGGGLVHDEEELLASLEGLLEAPTSRARMGQEARKVVLAGRGAAGHNLQLLRDYLPPDTIPRDSTSNQGIPSSHETSQTC